MVNYMVVARIGLRARPDAHIMKQKYHVKCTILSRSVDGIQVARKIGYRAVLKNNDTEVYIAKAGTGLDKKGFPLNPCEVLIRRYEDSKKTFKDTSRIPVGVMADRLNTPGVKEDHRLMMVRSDGSIWYDPTIWS